MGQRVAIYCRVSTRDQSCERQERDLRAFAERAGFEVVGVWKEVASGSRDQRPERKKVLALAQDRQVEGVLVTELTRWGRSTQDLLATLQWLQGWNVSLIAQTGLQFDLCTPQGKLIASLMAALSEFERDLLRERVRSGIAAVQARGKVLGRRKGDFVKSGRLEEAILARVEAGESYRVIGKALGVSKNTVMGVVHRCRGKERVGGDV